MVKTFECTEPIPASELGTSNRLGCVDDKAVCYRLCSSANSIPDNANGRICTIQGLHILSRDTAVLDRSDGIDGDLLVRFDGCYLFCYSKMPETLNEVSTRCAVGVGQLAC